VLNKFKRIIFPHRTQKAVPYHIFEVLFNLCISILLLLLLLPFVLGLLACFPAELIWNYGSYRQVLGLLGRVISPFAGSLLTYTGQHKHRKSSDRHLCLEWDSNAESQCLSGRRHFVLWTAQPLLSTILLVYLCLFSCFCLFFCKILLSSYFPTFRS
jgi:hypothetical protein